MDQIRVQVFTHFTRSSGSFERIAEITGLGEDVFIQCDYYDEGQMVGAIHQAFGIPRDQVSVSRSVEPVAGDFADFRRYAKENAVESDLAKRIKAAM